MPKTFRIKEIAELTSVTARTLHYYDEIDLLTPSHKTPSGHRLYSEEDILRLQQITALKYMGFSLEQISNIASNPIYNTRDSLRTQSTMIKDKAIRLQNVAKLLESIVNQLDIDDTINWTTITKIIEVMQMSENDRETWYKKYLSISELIELEEIKKRYSDEHWDIYNRQWEKLYKEVEANLHTLPESETGMQLAKKWLELVDEIYPRTSKLRKKLWEAFKAGVYPQNALSHDLEIINYITKATEKFKREQNRLG
jgi:DNA-binding transcriptional MerR regulator